MLNAMRIHVLVAVALAAMLILPMGVRAVMGI